MAQGAYENDIKSCPKCHKQTMVFKNRAAILEWVRTTISEDEAGRLNDTIEERYQSLGRAWLRALWSF